MRSETSIEFSLGLKDDFNWIAEMITVLVRVFVFFSFSSIHEVWSHNRT